MKYLSGFFVIMYIAVLGSASMYGIYVMNKRVEALKEVKAQNDNAERELEINSIDLSKFSKKYVDNVKPLKTVRGQRYCSSSYVQYGDKVYTVTNQHCCDAMEEVEGLRRVDNVLEKILYISDKHDVCILTSYKTKSNIKLAKKDIGYLDDVIILGYPRGEEFTPRQGLVLALNEWTPVQYDWDDVRSRPSHIVSFVSYPGNSGSPVFNKKGQLIGLLYAGPHPVDQYGIIVPLRYIKDALNKVSKKK